MFAFINDLKISLTRLDFLHEFLPRWSSDEPRDTWLIRCSLAMRGDFLEVKLRLNRLNL